MTKATFDYDEKRVCDHCGTNDQIHYNLVLFHGKTHFMDDPETPVWCNRCQAEAGLVDPGFFVPAD